MRDVDLDLEEEGFSRLPPPPKKGLSSIESIDVAVVVVEFREENFTRLPSAVIVVVEDLETDDLDRLEPLMDPLKKSILDAPDRVLKRLREIASNPNE